MNSPCWGYWCVQGRDRHTYLPKQHGGWGGRVLRVCLLSVMGMKAEECFRIRKMPGRLPEDRVWKAELKNTKDPSGGSWSSWFIVQASWEELGRSHDPGKLILMLRSLDTTVGKLEDAEQKREGSTHLRLENRVWCLHGFGVWHMVYAPELSVVLLLIHAQLPVSKLQATWGSSLLHIHRDQMTRKSMDCRPHHSAMTKINVPNLF